MHMCMGWIPLAAKLCRCPAAAPASTPPSHLGTSASGTCIPPRVLHLHPLPRHMYESPSQGRSEEGHG